LPPAPDAGVIEEARRRQRRRRVGGLAASGVAAAIAGCFVLIGGSGGSGVTDRHAGRLVAERPAKLALVHGQALIGGQPALIGVTPSLQAGNVGVCVKVVNVGACNAPPPTTTDPVYGEAGLSPEEEVGPAGEIDALFTAPQVAAVRVSHLGTFKARRVAGLPPGAKEVIFYRPPGSRGTVLAPGMGRNLLASFEHARHSPALTETLLDASGHVIRVRQSPTFTLPYAYWQGTQPPPGRGRCAMRSSLAGVRTGWGEVATNIAPDHGLTTSAWLPCLHVWYSYAGTSYETAILLNAGSPGSPPAPLWGAVPIPGHPGTVEIPPVEQEDHFRVAGKQHTFLDVLTPPTVARRIGPAWLLVRYGRNLAQRIAFLNALHVAPIKFAQRRS
jgi:hypothetical protein